MADLAARFSHFAGIDWSGAAGERHKGLAVALMGAGDPAPRLVRPGHVWSRAEVLGWIVAEAPADTLIGFDMGVSLPFADAGAFFPGWPASPPDARALWALVDTICAGEPHLGVSAFVDHPEISAYFRRPRKSGEASGQVGAHFGQGRGRWRVAEHAQSAIGLRPTSNFNLVGAAQVGKGSLAGMRLLHRLPREIAVWPVDPLPARGKVVLEIYSTIAAMAGGRPAGRSKVREAGALDAVLAGLGAGASGLVGAVPDHAADALMTAAWLRSHAGRAAYWQPRAMTPAIARTEGWTFGTG